jgi:transcriptional regulator GlxA family with amidase domain
VIGPTENLWVRYMKKVTVLALEKTMASTVTGPMDIFSLAGVLWNQIRGVEPTPFFEVKIASVNGKKVTCMNQTGILPDCAITEIDRTDLIVISVADMDMMNRDKKKIVPWLIEQFNKGATIASVCTGAFLLAETGLLNGKIATTHWGYIDLFKANYPKVILKPELLVTDEGTLLCGGGAHSYFDLCLYLVERYCGFDIAVQCSKSLLLDIGRRSQTPYTIFEFQKQHGDKDILKAQLLLENSFSREIHIEEIANQIGMSLRNFKRRFKAATGDTPLGYLQRFRIEAAKRALESKDKSIEQISGLVGYQDSAFFRQVFKKYMGLTPNAYRKKFLN